MEEIATSASGLLAMTFVVGDFFDRLTAPEAVTLPGLIFVYAFLVTMPGTFARKKAARAVTQISGAMYMPLYTPE